MTESMKYYESIRRKYPEAVSKDQFYQIAHISKATALHLLQNGLVPCKDTGKKTRRYTIRTDDIIFYLIDRELHPEVYRAPDRWYQERSGHYNSRVTYRNELTRLSEEERASFRKYMEDEFCQYGDLLTIVEVAEAIGYSPECMDKRNRYMVDHADVLIAVWDGSPSGTGKTVNYALRQGKPVVVINPRSLSIERR